MTEKAISDSIVKSLDGFLDEVMPSWKGPGLCGMS